MGREDKTRLPLSNETPAPRRGPSARERVVRRFRKLAPLAVIAAAPVLNTACDPAPEPYCTQEDSVLVANIVAQAVWVDAGGGAVRLQVTITVSQQYMSLSGTYLVTGGTLDTTQNVTGGQVLDITPDSGVTEVVVTSDFLCTETGGTFQVKITWTGTPAVGDTAQVEVTPVNPA